MTEQDVRDVVKWMMRTFVIVSLAIVLGFVCAFASGTEYATETENGTEWDAYAETLLQNAEERVLVLPRDSEKWFISVIGNPKDKQFKNILLRFDRNKRLKGLKIQVHFWVVPTTSPAYKARYEKNTKVLPTIRVQRHDGKVVWEAAAKGIPLTAEGLYIAIKNSSVKTMALLPWRRNGTILPWRDQMEQKCRPVPTPPYPVLVPVSPDPKPAPLDDGGPPEFEDTRPALWLVVCLAVLSALAGGAGALVIQAKKSSASE